MESWRCVIDITNIADCDTTQIVKGVPALRKALPSTYDRASARRSPATLVHHVFVYLFNEPVETLEGDLRPSRKARFKHQGPS